MTIRISELRRNIEEELPTTQFVGGFPKEQVSVVASAPGTGKTWFVIKTAMDLSVGGFVFFNNVQAEKPAKCVVMCGEGGFRMLTERRTMITTPCNPDNIAIYTLTDLAEAEVEISLDTKEGCDNLRKIITGEKADICFIDSFIAFRDEDESKQGDTSRALKRLITIARKTNCAIVLTHHTRKRKRGDIGEPTQDDIIGSSAIIRLCATAWTMNVQQDNPYTSLACVKTWYRHPETLYWRLQENYDGTLRFERSLSETLDQQKTKVQKYLALASAGDCYSIEMLQTLTFCSQKAIEDAMNEIAESGYGKLGYNSVGDRTITITK